MNTNNTQQDYAPQELEPVDLNFGNEDFSLIPIIENTTNNNAQPASSDNTGGDNMIDFFSIFSGGGAELENLLNDDPPAATTQAQANNSNSVNGHTQNNTNVNIQQQPQQLQQNAVYQNLNNFSMGMLNPNFMGNFNYFAAGLGGQQQLLQQNLLLNNPNFMMNPQLNPQMFANVQPNNMVMPNMAPKVAANHPPILPSNGTSNSGNGINVKFNGVNVANGGILTTLHNSNTKGTSGNPIVITDANLNVIRPAILPAGRPAANMLLGINDLYFENDASPVFKTSSDDTEWPILVGKLNTQLFIAGSLEYLAASTFTTDRIEEKISLACSYSLRQPNVISAHINDEDNTPIGYLGPPATATALYNLLKEGKIKIYITPQTVSETVPTTVVMPIFTHVYLCKAATVKYRAEDLVYDSITNGKTKQNGPSVKHHFVKIFDQIFKKTQKKSKAQKLSKNGDVSGSRDVIEITSDDSDDDLFMDSVDDSTLDSGDDLETENLASKKPDEKHDFLDEIFSSTFNSSSSGVMAEMDTPEGLDLELRSYQKQALAWMYKRESETNKNKKRKNSEVDDGGLKLHPLFSQMEFAEGGGKFYFNRYTGEITIRFPQAPPDPKGGILADDMGLGKTIEVLSLIAATKKEPPLLQQQYNPYQNNNNTKPTIIESNATLIVSPLSVSTQWEKEVLKHTNPQMNVLLYYGTQKITDINKLAKDYDVIIVTYSTMTSEYKKATSDKGISPLYSISFFRIVLDEAHCIKNRNSLTAKAAFKLMSERRWAVTGTPIQNSLDDLFALLHFIRVKPFDDYTYWCKNVLKPFEKKDDKALVLLQTITSNLVLRRTKQMEFNGSKLVDLPDKDVQIVRLQFTKEEEAFYNALYSQSKKRIDMFVQSDSIMQNYASVLELLLRLRQACDHPALVLNSHSNSNAPKKKSITKANPVTECYICMEICDDPQMHKQTCNNYFCKSCINEYLENQGLVCPACKTSLPGGERDLISCEPEADDFVNSTLDIFDDTFPYSSKQMKANWRSSTKIDALIHDLQINMKEDASTKSVIFSQWTSMLDLIEAALKRTNSIQHMRLDGSMTRKAREKAVENFKSNPRINVMLISLKAGGVGLNLVWATHVYIMDPWWNPAIEDQAIDRVHRIGQTSDVTVKKFIIEGSMEEKMLQLHQKKTAIAQVTMAKNEMKKVKIADLKMLFELM